jgi:polyhydroxyalkanoate synthesis regulator phasin
MKPETGMGFGRQAEITRDELKFSKFISRLRKKFTELFDDLLKTQLVLKGVMSAEDWDKIKEDIYYEFTQDSYTAEAKASEIMRNRLDLLNTINPFVGSYFSREFVYDKILQMTEDEVADMQADIEADTDLQQMMAAQQQGQEQPAQGPAPQGQTTDQPAAYNPDNPMIETVLPAINNIMELRKVRL